MMARHASKKRGKSLPAKCPDCGAPQLTVWMNSGRAAAVNPEKIEVIFCNMAMAGGHRMGAFTEHKCKGG